MSEVSANIQTYLSQIDAQLNNGVVTTPAFVKFDRDGITVGIAAADMLYTFEFALVGASVRLVERRVSHTGVEANMRKIHDYSADVEPAKE